MTWPSPEVVVRAAEALEEVSDGETPSGDPILTHAAQFILDAIRPDVDALVAAAERRGIGRMTDDEITDLIGLARVSALRDGEAHYIQRAAESQQTTTRTIHMVIADAFRSRADEEASE
jgi:hypothetical protein